MFNLHLYTVQAEVNRVDKSSELSEDFTVSGTLRDDCSIIDPVIVVQGSELLVNFNYAYVEEFKRYYFITDITAMNNGMWELSMHVDVLMSFKDGLLKLPALIERNEQAFNEFLIDERFPITGVYEYDRDESVSLGSVFDTDKDDENMILAVITSNVYGEFTETVNNRTYHGGIFVADSSAEGQLGTPLNIQMMPWNNGLFCLFFDKAELAALLHHMERDAIIRDSLVSLFVIPHISKEQMYGIATRESMYIYAFHEKFHDPAYPREVDSSLAIGKETYQAFGTTKIGWQTGVYVKSYLDMSPYTVRYLFLPFYGRFQINDSYFDLSQDPDDAHIIRVDIAFDWTTVEVCYTVRIDGRVTANVTATFGTSIPVFKSNLADIYAAENAIATRLIGNLFSTAVDTVINGASGNAASAAKSLVGGVAESVTNFVSERERLVPAGSTAGTSNGLLNMLNNEFPSCNCMLHTFRCKKNIPLTDTNYLSLNGRPLHEARHMSETHGYTEVGNIHLENFLATSSEKEEIERKLKMGVILP